MEVKIIIAAVCLLIGFIVGYLLGRIWRSKQGGQIIFSPGDEGPKCTFKLNFDVEELMQKRKVYFIVTHQNDSYDSGLL